MGFGLTSVVDDGIVVVRSGTGRAGQDAIMTAFARSVLLKQRLGHDGVIELDTALDASRQEWKEQVVELVEERFERRLAQELSMVRMEITDTRLSVIRWVAGLLIAHAGVIIATVFTMMTFLVNALKP
jgi:hypothetical protein